MVSFSMSNQYYPYGVTPIELCKIGDYQDYIYKDSDKWYKHGVIGKVVLDGSETWANLEAGMTVKRTYTRLLPDPMTANTREVAISDYFLDIHINICCFVL